MLTSMQARTPCARPAAQAHLADWPHFCRLRSLAGTLLPTSRSIPKGRACRVTNVGDRTADGGTIDSRRLDRPPSHLSIQQLDRWVTPGMLLRHPALQASAASFRAALHGSSGCTDLLYKAPFGHCHCISTMLLSLPADKHWPAETTRPTEPFVAMPTLLWLDCLSAKLQACATTVPSCSWCRAPGTRSSHPRCWTPFTSGLRMAPTQTIQTTQASCWTSCL